MDLDANEHQLKKSADPLAGARWADPNTLDAVVMDTALALILGSIGVPERYRHLRLQGWYDFEGLMVISRTMILCGNVGTGKTGIVCAAIRDACHAMLVNSPRVQDGWNRSLKALRFIEYRNLTKLIRQFDSPEARADAEEEFETLCKMSLVIIDDLMAGVVREWDLVKLEELIDRRYGANLPLWLTTNYEDKDLRLWPGFERSYSRLFEMAGGEVFYLTGADRRMKGTKG